MALFGFVITVRRALGSEEAGHADATASLDRLSVARALVYQTVVHAESNDARGGLARLAALLTGSEAGARDFLAGVFVDAPALTDGTVVLGGVEQTICIADRDEVANESGWTQSCRALSVANRAIGGTIMKFRGALDLSTGVRDYAPTTADRTVALGGFEEAIFSALRKEFSGHRFTKILSCFLARANIFGALCSNRINDQEEGTSQR